MSDVLKAFMAKYDRVYNPEANERAIAEKTLAVERKKARQAEIERLFPPKSRKD